MELWWIVQLLGKHAIRRHSPSLPHGRSIRYSWCFDGSTTLLPRCLVWWKPVYRHCSPNSRDLCSGVVPDVRSRWTNSKYGSMGQDWRRPSRYWFLAKHQVIPPPWTWIENGDSIRSRTLHYFGTLSFWLASSDMNQYGSFQLYAFRNERILLIPMTAFLPILSGLW